MKLKSFTSFLLSFAVLTSFFAVNAQSNELMYFDFENINKTAVQYIADEPLIITSSTNNGIKSYDFVFENNSRKLMFTGYTLEEMAGNATRNFDFYLNKAYSLSEFPDTKLVVMYDISQKKFDCDNDYTHFCVQAGNTNICQVFILKNGTVPTYKPQNKYWSLPLDYENEESMRYVIDLANTSYILQAGNNKSIAIAPNGNSTSTIDKVRFAASKGEKYSVDNLRAVVVPNIFEITDYSGKNNTEVDVDDKVYVSFTAPLESNFKDYITVEKNGSTISTSEYTLSLCEDDDSKVEISFKNPMSFESTYTITFKSGISDIAYNTFSSNKSVSFTTESKPSFSLSSSVSKDTNGVSCSLTAQNNSQKEEDCEVMVLVYQNSALVGASYYEKTFEVSEADTTTSFFNCNTSGITIKSYVMKRGTSEVLCENTNNLN